MNIVVLMEPPETHSNISENAGNMYLNRFCIDEDSAFELSGIHYLYESRNVSGLKRRNAASRRILLNYEEYRETKGQAIFIKGSLILVWYKLYV